MASCQTSQWVNTAPYVKLTVTEKSSTGNSVTLQWTLQYIASSAANTAVNKSYSVSLAGSVIKSGTFNIDGKTGTHIIASGTKTINKTHSAQSIAFGCSFAFNLTWSDVYKGTLSASGSLSVAAKTQYTVSYDANGGSGAPSAQTKWFGEALTLQTGSPTRTGYTFQGWATSKSGSAAYSPGEKYTGNAALLLYAVWKANTYSVTYNANGGTGAPTSQAKTHGQALTLSSVKPTRVNYASQGWATSATSTTVAYKPGASYTANAALSLYAVWVLAYTKPRVTDISVMRVDSSGAANDSGANVAVRFSYDCDFGNPAVTVLCKKSSVSGWDDVIPFYSSPGDLAQTQTVEFVWQNLSSEFSYTFRIYVNDGGSEDGTVVIRTLSAATFPIDFKPPTETSKVGVSIGKPAELAGVFDVGLELLAHGGFRHLVLEPNTDLNDVKTPNTYIGANIASNVYGNCPLASGTFTLTVEGAGESGQIKQILTRCSKTEPERYIRFFYQSTWSEWMPDVPAVVYVKTANTDLNDYLQTGVWYFNSNYTPANVPSGSVNGWLVVLRADNGALKQLWLRYGKLNNNDSNIYVRTGNGEEWGGWRRIMSEPVVLYDNASGSNGTITIDSIYGDLSDFDYVEIFFEDNNGKEGGYCKIFSPANKTITLSLVEASASSMTLVRRTIYTSTTTQFKPNTANCGFFTISGTSASHTAGSNYICITRILGHFK
jgi:uncharacterized repeat protein (TIGR02543 family)